ncbi:TIR domain-containing protein [Parafrankia sp. EUN1f]|uniref:TIR domain-containing protein n=1 Tax=Parafrankia sp. EUN1f TaxID=102897 RepID=UPI001E611D63|nr:TIR domain-containing protein [Parafrankia sp. EUN1f]
MSYAPADHEWAAWIAWQLEHAGYSVLVAAWDVVPGSIRMGTLDRVRACDQVLAVLSPDYLTSVYGTAEWRLAWTDDPDGDKRRLVPVRVQSCEPPSVLSFVTPIDLVGLDESGARDRLLAGITASRTGRGKPTGEVPFPGPEGKGRKSAPYRGNGTEAAAPPFPRQQNTGSQRPAPAGGRASTGSLERAPAPASWALPATLDGWALTELEAALSPLHATVRTPVVWDDEALSALKADMDSRLPSLETSYVAWVAENLTFALRTTTFLRQWIPGLTTTALRRALNATLTGVAGTERMPVAQTTRALDYVAWVALRYPDAAGPTCQRTLVDFVIRLACETGSDPWSGAFTEWAVSMEDWNEVNERRLSLVEKWEKGRWRLVVSLYSHEGSWPEQIEGWLVDDSGNEKPRSYPISQEHLVEPPGEERTSREVVKVLEWARWDQDRHVQQVDLAVPTKLLADGPNGWRPEEIDVGPMLGTMYRVTIRWSDRLRRGRGLLSADRRLESISSSVAVPPVHWIDPADTADPHELRRQLKKGRYPEQALGVLATPSTDLAALLEVLLDFSPIVLWSDSAPTTVWPDIKHAVGTRWGEQLPHDLIRAYLQRRQSTPGTTEAPPLSFLRAVWEDKGWLKFCQSQIRRGAEK